MAINFGKIGVLMGGVSSEREISLKSGKAVCGALEETALSWVAVDITTESREENIKLLKAKKIDCAFLAMHGRFGEDGQIQGILESLNIPYTGSGSLASKLAMDKIASRNIFHAQGLNVPEKIGTATIFLNRLVLEKMVAVPIFPCVVKPAACGSSIGLSIVDKDADLLSAVELALSYDERALIEEYIEGREMTVGILEEQPLPVIEIVPKKRFFDFQAKYQTGMAEYILPAQLAEDIAKKIQAAALSAHKALGCSGCSRVDLILNKENKPFILELNSIPGFTQTSLLPKAARLAGIEFGQLCVKLIELAYNRKGGALAKT